MRMEVERALRAYADPSRVPLLQRYFKTGPGEYGEGDRFLGLRVPQVRAVAKRFRALDLDTLQELLRSAWHEERQLALLVMIDQYRRGAPAQRQALFDLYLAHTAGINNWDLVDVSAPRIVGAHVKPTTGGVIGRLSRSPSVWERRIAIMASGHWIAEGTFAPTFTLVKRLMADEHDLIHKAAGWMLREIGKRDRTAEESFLERHHAAMPRTMLRYAIEHFPERRRRQFLNGA